MQINYVLIDYENVQPSDLHILQDVQYRVFVFVGKNQEKVPLHMVAALQNKGETVKYIKISGGSKNALDFHLTYYIGQVSAMDPKGFFHIVSKDTGFDSLVTHLKENGLQAVRVDQVCDIPSIKRRNVKSPADRASLIIEQLDQMRMNKPRTLKALTNVIAARFQNQLTDGEISRVIKTLEKRGYIQLSNGKVECGTVQVRGCDDNQAAAPALASL